MKITNLKQSFAVATACAAASLIVSTLASADEVPASQSTFSADSSRTEKKIGAYLSVLGDPSPTLVGVNAAYNVTDYLRANVGFGRVSASIGDLDASLTTIGIGAKAMVPGWSLTPTAGLGLSYAMFSGNTSVGGLTGNELNPYLSFGFDWQAQSGFNAGVVMNVSLNGASSNPCLNLGWFF
jgi:hypothetical protein